MAITYLSASATLASRRRVLRGLCDGAAVSFGLPFLACFLNDHEDALAASGAPLPPRFCSWFWGLGFTPGLWEPQKIGPGYEMARELAPLAPYRDKVNVFTGFQVLLDGNAPVPHFSGYRGILNGTCGAKASVASIDSLIADRIGTASRFRSIEVAATGDRASSVSRRSASVTNPAEVSPAALYGRLFGAGFADPNAKEYRPDPRIMARKSAMSAISEERKALMRELGSADRARLDEYFTSLRQLERQLDVQIAPPAPRTACAKPTVPDEGDTGSEIELTMATHRLMAGLVAHALACDQTRVANIVLTDATSSLRKAGQTATHHALTHDEPVDATLGYQPQVKWFNDRIVLAFKTLLDTFDAVPEGDGTLLDHLLVFASSESGSAKAHTLRNIPMMTAGSAGGRVKTGLHVAGEGEVATRVGLTLQQAFGVQAGAWGIGAMQTGKPITEILA